MKLFAQRIDKNGIHCGDRIALTDVNGNCVGFAEYK